MTISRTNSRLNNRHQSVGASQTKRTNCTCDNSNTHNVPPADTQVAETIRVLDQTPVEEMTQAEIELLEHIYAAYG